MSHRLGDLVERAADRRRGASGYRGFGGGKPVTVAGEINEVKKRGPRTILMLDDGTGWLEVTLFDDVFQQYRDLIAKHALVIVEGKLRFDEFSDGWRLAAKQDQGAREGARGAGAAPGAALAGRARIRAIAARRLAEILGPGAAARAPSRWNTRAPARAGALDARARTGT